MDNVKRVGYFAQILGERIGEKLLNIGRVIDAENDQGRTNCLRESVRLPVGPWGDFPEPSVAWRPFESEVRTRADVKADHENSDPQAPPRYSGKYFTTRWEADV